MIIYKDLITGDEIISDSYDVIEKDDVVYEINCKRINKGTENDFDIGANASAEEQVEDLEAQSTTVIDIVDAFRYNEMSGAFPSAKDYTSQLKGYLKKVSEKLKENGADEATIKKFQSGTQNYFVKTIKPNFKDYELFAGESMDTDGMLVLLNYREDGVTPYITVWKYGLSEMKV